MIERGTVHGGMLMSPSNCGIYRDELRYHTRRTIKRVERQRWRAEVADELRPPAPERIEPEDREVAEQWEDWLLAALDAYGDYFPEFDDAGDYVDDKAGSQ